MTNDVCLNCKRMISDHSKDEVIHCAIKICHGGQENEEEF